MPDIDATVGSATANSFVTTDEADTYLDARSNAGAWNDETDDDQKARALIDATRQLNLLLYIGTRVDTTQALAWPRNYATDPDKPNIDSLGDISLLYFANDVIPQRIKDATCELALEFLRAGTTDIASQDTSLNVTRLVAGPIELDFAAAVQRKQGLERYDRVVQNIYPLLASAGQGLKVVRC